MKISIITVCYNSAKTIEETLKSVQNQTYKNIEYIVIDGASKDATTSIIEKYKDIITYFSSEPDKGLYDAMNKGIQQATGDYVGIINSDDVFYDNKTIEKVADYFAEHPHLDAITGNIVQHKNNRIIRKYSSANWSPEKLKRGFMPPHPAIFMKTSLYHKFGLYRLDYKISADYELIIRFFLKEKISYQYSGITTTSMAVGGASSSGYKSYKVITREVKKAFKQNNIGYSPLKVRFRFLWKIFGYINVNK
ncbi:hypothetical protein FIC_01934 [Flavobacteriaceae bacterium 3519-10]|nr:hypothetical protein FIC_01934 [Flavobacteriaceae bacterium 3519-10]